MIVGYYEDGPNLISIAMNGWGAVGFEREQLWQRWRELDQNLDGYAALRAQETAVVVLEPRTVAE